MDGRSDIEALAVQAMSDW